MINNYKKLNNIIIAFLIFLSGVILFSWFDFKGEIKNSTWAAPEPIHLNLKDYSKESEEIKTMDNSESYLILNQRPIFVMGRIALPSVSKEPVVVVPKENILDKLEVLGVFSGQKQGVIVILNGKERSLMLHDKLEDWTLNAVDNYTAKFVRGEENREIVLKKPQY